MVSFTSIAQCVALVSIMMVGSSTAAPAGDSASSSSTAAAAAPHTTDNSTTVDFKFPPIISSRTSPAANPPFLGDLDAETQSMEANKKWFVQHGGNLTAIEKRDSSNTVAGFTLVAPENAPPLRSAKAKAIVNASSAQITEFKHHAAIASTAYCDTVVPAGKWSCTNCLKYVPDGKLIVTFSSKIRDIGGFLLRSDSKKTIYLVFRGTNSYTNWVVNADFIKTKYKPVSGAEVHKGFYDAYNEVSSYYFSQLQEQHKKYADYEIIVTGHSLGGAQALLATMDLYQRIPTLNTDNLKIYTVGSPRVGNSDFAYYVDSTGIPHSRSVNNRDIVPHVPPQSFGFLHPGVEAWAKSGTTAQICTSNIETNSCSNSIVPFTSIDDHRVYYDIKEGTCV
ncbi:hypothetical protein HPULCUR_000739 [Helicostylum pulchrum]|uniref:Fungal lipase-type domain-containing protein n=1 Tax=Helicostylum pulchrum TaxID=562976 RepID=A0ABP9XMM8_9FUNG